MRDFRIDVDGVDELNRRLRSVANKLDLKNVYNYLSSKTKQIIQEQAPVVTGRLVDSMKRSSSANHSRVWSNLVYAPVINYGWRAHNIEPNRYVQRTTAEIGPFVKPTLQVAIDIIIRREGLS